MSDEFYTLSKEAIKRLQDQFAHLEHQVRNLRAQTRPDSPTREGAELYFGKTTTNAANPTYPTSGNTFVVKLVDSFFAESTGNQDEDRKESLQYVIARTVDGSHVAENTDVRLERRTSRRGVRWWIETGGGDSVVHIRLTEVLHPGASATGRLVEWSEDDEDWSDPDEDADDVRLSDVPFMVPVSGEDPIRSGWNFGLIDEVFQAVKSSEFLATEETPEEPPPATYLTIGSWGLTRQAAVVASSSPLLPTEAGAVRITIDGGDDVDLDVAESYGPASPWFDEEEVTVDWHRDKGKWFIRNWARRRMRGTTSETITNGSTGDVDLTNGETVTAALNWMAGTSDLASGKECIVEWFEDEGGTGAWVITGAAC